VFPVDHHLTSLRSSAAQQPTEALLLNASLPAGKSRDDNVRSN